MHHYIWKNHGWANFFWDEKKLLPLLSEVRLKQGRLIEKIETLHHDESIKVQSEVLIEETVKTARIEGETYTLEEVRSSVHQKLGLSQAGLPAAKRNIDGLVTVLLDATSHSDQELHSSKLKAWHAALFPTGYSGLRKIKAGKFRDDAEGPMQVVSGSIGREKIHYQAPSAEMVQEEINQFLLWWKRSQGRTEGILRAGIAHFYFVTIHPFEDGNGRIARAITDMALAQDDHLEKRYYSLSEQILTERKHYYSILEKTQKGDSDITEWLVWFIECFSRALDNSDILLKTIFQKANFWREHQKKEINSRQRKVLNKMLDAGQDNFMGGLTTRKYVGMTKVSRATAYREIHDLLKKKMLKLERARGRSMRYDIRWSINI